MSKLAITGGTLVTPEGSFAGDVLVEGEHILALVAPGSWQELGFVPTEVLDAAGKLVIPGGVDVHTHMEMPSAGGIFSSDSFETGSKAALWGGTTTIVDFATQTPGHSLKEALREWEGRACGNSVVDYGFHMIVSDVSDASLAEIPEMIERGVTSFKLFMAYPGRLYSDDGAILRAMQVIAANGALAQVHAENGIAIDVLVAQAVAKGEVDPWAHVATRPSILEGEATHRAIVLAQVAGAKVYIVHISALEALDEVTKARDEGLEVYGETCPQYLFLSEDALGWARASGAASSEGSTDPFEGAKYVCSPPLRSQEHQEKLWEGIRRGDLSTVATDHCPYCFKGAKELGRGDFRKIPNGLPGVENRMDLLHEGVVQKRISLERWVQVACTAPAKLFGLYPRKGTLAPGSDADIVIYDPEKRHVLSASSHHMAVDYSVYEGMEVTGEVDTVIARGEVVLRNQELVAKPGRGEYLPRLLPAPI
jgi:dihydropyrimidinase